MTSKKKELLHLSGLDTISLTSEVLFPLSSSKLKWTELEEIVDVFLMKKNTIYFLNAKIKLDVIELDKVEELTYRYFFCQLSSQVLLIIRSSTLSTFNVIGE